MIIEVFTILILIILPVSKIIIEHWKKNIEKDVLTKMSYGYILDKHDH